MTTYLSAILVLGGLGAVLALLLALAQRFLADYGPCSIRVNEREPFVVEGGGKLLEALYEQRIYIPSACGGQGTCGFCKVEVAAGDGGPVLPTELPFLSAEERRGGIRLACQVKVKRDLRLRVRADFLAVREFRAAVDAAEPVTHDTRAIRLTLVDPSAIEFRSGQYVQVRVPGLDEETFRAYSICSPPSRAGEVELLVRLIPGGLGSSYLHAVQPGDEVRFTGPYGDFALDSRPDGALVCVGGGCGLAPMRSILRHLREVAPARRCWLFFGVRTERDAMYLEEFEALRRDMPGLEVHCAVSEPRSSPGWRGETGFIHESVRVHLPDRAAGQAFLCGPAPMIRATVKVLGDKGVPKEGIFFDEF